MAKRIRIKDAVREEGKEEEIGERLKFVFTDEKLLSLETTQHIYLIREEKYSH